MKEAEITNVLKLVRAMNETSRHLLDREFLRHNPSCEPLIMVRAWHCTAVGTLAACSCTLSHDLFCPACICSSFSRLSCKGCGQLALTASSLGCRQ